MIRIDINKLELPEFDIILATPVCIPLEKCKNPKELYFKIPNCREYFIFEAHYLKILKMYFTILSKVSLLEYKEFKNMKLKEQLFKQLRPVMQNNEFLRDFLKIIIKYFTANYKIKKTLKYIDPMQLSYLFLFIHKVVETVKKKFLQLLAGTSDQMSDTFFTSSNPHSTKIEPRF